MKNTLFFSLLCLIIIVNGCNSDVDFNAEYKDITVVYGLLNNSEPVQYVKIYKGFLTNENAIIAAGNPENIYYYNTIDVELQEYVNKTLRRTIPLTLTDSVSKDDGIFPNPTQYLYATAETVDQAATYKLVITNKETGKVVNAETPIVNDFRISAPLNSINVNKDKSEVKFSKADNATAYELYWTFYYKEKDTVTNTVTEHSIKTKMNSAFIRSTSNDISYEFRPRSFFTNVSGNMNKKKHVIRCINTDYCMKIEIWAGAEDFITYIDVSRPSGSIVQDKETFTNMSSTDGNAIGIFSSRNYISSRYKFYNAGEITSNLDSLCYGSVTGHLGFVKEQF